MEEGRIVLSKESVTETPRVAYFWKPGSFSTIARFPLIVACSGNLAGLVIMKSNQETSAPNLLPCHMSVGRKQWVCFMSRCSWFPSPVGLRELEKCWQHRFLSVWGPVSLVLCETGPR